jgi:hypothetical protein
VLLWDVKRFAGVIDLLGGIRVVDTVHVLIFIFFVFYMFIHPYLATLGHTPTAHIKAMLTGYEESGRRTAGERGGIGTRALNRGRFAGPCMSRTRMSYFFIRAWKFARCMPVSSALLVTFQRLRLSVLLDKASSRCLRPTFRGRAS